MPEAPRWAATADVLVVLVAGWMLWGLLAVWGARWSYPFDLEWMEGGMLAHGWRLQHGLPLYADPTADWVPYVYPPGYSAMLAATGPWLDFPAGRLISIVGSLFAAGALVEGVRRHGRSLTLGLLSGAVFLLSYRASGAFFDLVRPDAIAMALAGWAIVISLDGRKGTDLAGGLLLAAAFVVKHNLAAFGVPLALGLWAWRGWRSALRFGLASALPALALTGYLQWRSGGGFLTYLLEVPGSHPMMWRRGFPGSPGETGHWLGVVMATVGVGLALAAPRRGSSVHPVAVWGGGALAGAVAAVWAVGEEPVFGAATPDAPVMALTFFALGASVGSGVVAGLAAVVERRIHGPWWTAAGLFWMGAFLAVMMRAHNGGFINVLIPWHWVICGLTGVLLGHARRVRWSDGARMAGAILGPMVILLQLGSLYSMSENGRITPSDADLKSGEELLHQLETRCDGPIFSPFAAWLPVRVGQAPSAHLIAIWDIDHKKGPLHRYMRAFPEATRTHHFSCVVDAGRKPIGYGVQEHYRKAHAFQGRGGATKTGWPVRPRTLYVPKESR